MKVVFGLGVGNLVEVFGDLSAGDEVVIRGAEGLSDGMPIEILRAAGK